MLFLFKQSCREIPFPCIRQKCHYCFSLIFLWLAVSSKHYAKLYYTVNVFDCYVDCHIFRQIPRTFFEKVFLFCSRSDIILCATQFNIFLDRHTFGKNVCFDLISCLGMNCVATEVKLRFSVRGFGHALFI